MEEYAINLKGIVKLSEDQKNWLKDNSNEKIFQIVINGINEELSKSASVLSAVIDTIKLEIDQTVFVVSNHFKVQDGDENIPKIVSLSADFHRNYLKKTEQIKSLSWLYTRQLTRNANDREIIEALPRHRSTTKLAQLYKLLQIQSQGSEGYLAVDGSANIFFIENVLGEVEAVRVLWFNGWIIDSLPLDAAYWLKARKVFSS